MEDGSEKMVTEHYVVDAMSFTEAESAIIEHMQPYISGDFKVTGIRPAAYGEVFFSEEGNADRWYKVRIAFITIDEKTEKEKKSFVYLSRQRFMSQWSLEESRPGFHAKSMLDYQSVNISKSNLLDVFEHKTEEKTDEKKEKE